MIFAHANSFPASTYSLLFRSLRARGHQVRALEMLGHDPRFPVTDNWTRLSDQLAEFVQQQVTEAGRPVPLVGHSLGGFLSVMVACQHPTLVKGVLLLDAPLLGGWRARAVALAKRTGLVDNFSPGKVSARRRKHWPDAAAALAHFQGKRAFAAWHPQVLQDYIDYGTHDDATSGERVLSFDRAVETAIYNHIPHTLPALLRRHPLQCPVAFIGGQDSAEMKQVGMDLTQRITQGRVHLVPGTHLFPMEYPLETAAKIDEVLLTLAK